MTKASYLFLLISFILPASIIPQTQEKQVDKLYDWEKEYNVVEWYSSSRPMIELNYGIGELKHKKFSGSFAKSGQGDLKIGYSRQDLLKDSSLIDLSDKYLQISYFSHSLQGQTAAANDLRSVMTRFGIGWRSGYGYKTGIFTITPFHSNGFMWTMLDMKDFPPDSQPEDVEIINRYNKEIRFGDVTEGGLNIAVGKLVAVHGSYEAGVIFPRHVFWLWAGSSIIESIGRGLIDAFVDEVFDASPYAAPIVDFVLKNAWNYTFYALKRDKMNFPFNSETPLTYETFKLGVTFTF